MFCQEEVFRSSNGYGIDLLRTLSPQGKNTILPNLTDVAGAVWAASRLATRRALPFPFSVGVLSYHIGVCQYGEHESKGIKYTY